MTGVLAGARIHRTLIPVDDQWHEVHIGAVLHVATRREDAVEIWFVDPSPAGLTIRSMRVFGTGHSLGPQPLVHVGSVITPSGRLVWHLMERPA